MSLSNILLIPGVGQMTFRDALLLLSPYSPRFAANYMEPAGSLYTDASRTSQVTTAGNRIRSFTNFVTGGPHGVASSDAKSPLWNSYTLNGQSRFGALFDGGDDALTVSGFDLSDTDKVTVIAGVRKLSDAARGVLLEHSASVANNGTFNIEAPTAASPSYGFLAKGTAPIGGYGPSGFAAPITNWISCMYDLGGAGLTTQIIPRINNAINQTGGFNTASGGNFINSTLNIGGRNNAASLPFNGYLHYLFICGAIVPDSVLTRIYRGLGPRIGLTV